MALTRQEILSLSSIASSLGVELAALSAIVEVESNGQIFADVDGERLPVIRWEGHYFYRLLKGAQRDRAVKEKLAAPSAGAIKNPSSQAARYAILDKASRINSEAAHSSISIGVGQVMGEHAKSLGYKSAEQMFQAACSGLTGQVAIMAAFIRTNNLVEILRRRDWSAFARVYNGPAYRKNKYDEKMEKAYRRSLVTLGHLPVTLGGNASTMLRLGSKGAAVREIQALLVRWGWTLKVDGDFGPATDRAVRGFQEIEGLEVDGVVGPQTRKLLSQRQISPSEKLGEQKLVEIDEVPAAAGTSGGGLTTLVAADKLNEFGDKISGSGGTLDMIGNGLYVAGAILLVGGIAWGFYGFLKSRRTYEGTAR